MKVLMLGFEFPPRMSGGLGTACQGLAHALTNTGTEVLFVLPRLEGGEEAGGAELIAADSIELASVRDELPESPELPEPIDLIVPSPLQPYQDEASYRKRLASLRKRSPHVPPEERLFTHNYGAHLHEEVQRYARAVAEIAAGREFGVIHAHDWMSFPAGILARELTGRPLVCHVHSSEYDRRPVVAGRSAPRPDPRIIEVEKAGLEAADRIVCVSRRAADELSANYRISQAKIRVVHNGIAPAPRREGSASSNDEASTVLFLGRLTHQKGPEYFLEAAALVMAEAPDTHFVVSGSGALLPDLIEQARELGLDDNIRFTGFLEGEERERAFQNARVYVMPSVSEPFGITPLEAMARNVPVIVSRQAGVVEVAHSVLKVDYWDTEALAESILGVLQRPALHDELVAQGRAEVERLRWDRPAQRMVGIYGEVIA